MTKQLIYLLILAFAFGCSTQKNISDDTVLLQTSPENRKRNLELEFVKGKYFNHPSFAIWVEDLEGNYIETLFVTQYVAKGKFGHGEIKPGVWKNEPGEVRRPASLPYWSHKRNIQAADGLFIPSPETAVPDAISGATPKGNFQLNTATSLADNKKFRILFEINQAWDSNKFWTNNKFPGDQNYFASLQPALVYSVLVDPNLKGTDFYLNPIGHSHPSGETGELFTDLTTISTSKEIAHKIIVRLK